MNGVTDTYRRELLTALKLRNVHPDLIGEIIAEVDSHLADSGEDPRQAFGPAAAYARQFPPRDADMTASSKRRRDVIRATIGAAVGFVSAVGTFAVARGDDRALGLPSWIVLALGVVGAFAVAALLSRSVGRVVDPRTGRPADPVRPWFVPSLLGAYFVLIAACGVVAVLTT